MFNFMQKHKIELKQAQLQAQIAEKHSKQCIIDAQQKTKSYLSSPAGIASAFGAGAIKGAASSKGSSSISSLLPILFRLF